MAEYAWDLVLGNPDLVWKAMADQFQMSFLYWVSGGPSGFPDLQQDLRIALARGLGKRREWIGHRYTLATMVYKGTYWFVNRQAQIRQREIDGMIRYSGSGMVPSIHVTDTPNLEQWNNQCRIEIDRAMSSLPERHRDVVKLRFGLNEDGQSYTLNEAGRVFKVSSPRVSQLEAKACRLLSRNAALKQLHDERE